MYFSIPDSSEIPLKKNSTHNLYRFYHIHVNGTHHCSVRYSQLFALHNQLQRNCSTSMKTVQLFPSKKFFHLSIDDIEDRRLLLERYLQSIVQKEECLTCDYFNQFFLQAQYETCQNQERILTISEKISLSIYLLNHDEIFLDNIPANLTSDQLFILSANQCHIEKHYRSYFGLFYYEKNLNQMNLIRPLFSFEYPYLSLKQLGTTYKNPCLILKKSSWCINDDEKLIDQPAACKLLFIQAIYDVEQMRFLSLNLLDDQLEQLRRNNSSKEYITLARQIKFHGFTIIRSCSISYSIDENHIEQHLPCLVAIGNYEMICYFPEKNYEIPFSVTRIRCWKVVWTNDERNLTFEYLFQKDVLTWIRLHTEHAALISTCLQGMVDEILKRQTQTNQSNLPILSFNRQHSTLLPKRTQIELNHLNNSHLFDRGNGDDDL